MTRFSKVYEKLWSKKEKTYNVNALNREGYGYIKRRVGLLSNELKGPTYLALSGLSEFLKKEETKS